MEIALLAGNTLKIALSARDLKELSMDPIRLGGREPAAKRALTGLMEKGRTKTGFPPKNARLCVDVYPDGGDGCVIYFTTVGIPAQSQKSETGGIIPVVFAFSDIQILCECAGRLFFHHGHRVYKSSLYRCEKEYRLILYPLDYCDELSVLFTGEYGKKLGTGELLAALTDEHGAGIIFGNAIEVLSTL